MATTSEIVPRVPMTRRAFWTFFVFVAVVAPIAVVFAVLYLSKGDRVGGAILTVALLTGCIFGLISRMSSVSPASAALGFVLSACLAVPWGYGLLITAIFFACRGQEQCFS